MSLPEFSIKRPVTVLMACLVCILLGAISFVEIPVDLMPEIEQPTLSINIDYPGVAPEEIETLIARPLEQIVSSAPGVEEVTSTSTEGRASVRVEFVYGTDIDVATDEVRSRLDRGRRSLPDDIEPPFIFKFDVSQFPIMFITAASADYGPKELRTFIEKNVVYRLERVPGVGQVSVNGGLRREIHVDLDLEKLRSLDLSVDQVVQRIRSENLNRPVGPVKEGRFELLLRTSGEYESIEQILNVALTARDGVPVYVRDVATVEDSHEDIRFYVAVNGVEGLRIIISKQSGANTVKVSEGIWNEVAAIEHDYPNVQIDKTMDTADFIIVAIDNVKTAALAGSALAVIVLLVFLRSFSATLIIGVAIPISVISTFALMYFNGFTLNTVSFGGLALGVGMLVDNAIVVLENIYRHREDGTPLKEAAIVGSNEVATAITASTFTTIAVFVPVVFMGGYSAQTFQQLAYVVSFSLLCSLLAGLTVVPALCSKLLRGTKAKAMDSEGGFLGGLGDSYGRAIEWSLDHRLIVTGAAVGLFAFAMWLVPFLGVELQPQVDEGTLRVNVELESGTNAATTKQVIDRMYNIVKEEVPEAVYVMTEAGQNSPFRGVAQHLGELRIILNSSEERDRSAAEVANVIRPMLMSVVPGSQVRTRVDSGNFGRRGGGDSSDRLSVEIRGHNPEITAGLAEQVQQVMMRTPGVVEAQVSRQPGLPEMVVKIDRLKSASMGMTVESVADTLETAVGGRRASFYREEGDEYDIVVRLREEDRLAASQVGDIPLRAPNGQLITADQVVRMQRQEGPTQIDRIDQERIIFVSGAIADRDLGSVVADLQAALDEIPRPAGYEFKMGGEYEEQVKAFNDLLFACILAFILVYMVMAAQFESLRDPFIIIFSIPLAAIGVVLMLLLTNTTFNMQGFLGVIILVGIVVNNAIVLVDYANQLRREHGYNVRDAVVTAGSRRLRPILMTTATTVLGLIPMSLGIGEGSELQVPMARVVIGGLVTSTLITLVFIPVVYSFFEEMSERSAERRTQAAAQPAAGD
ncbi:MAG: efflux RND transporter permease subunit [Acidobacteria bacterium]|nr:efflux RND transporter permease subunit [Acidobacteriota bacterium]